MLKSHCCGKFFRITKIMILRIVMMTEVISDVDV